MRRHETTIVPDSLGVGFYTVDDDARVAVAVVLTEGLDRTVIPMAPADAERIGHALRENDLFDAAPSRQPLGGLSEPLGPSARPAPFGCAGNVPNRPRTVPARADALKRCSLGRPVLQYSKSVDIENMCCYRSSSPRARPSAKRR